MSDRIGTILLLAGKIRFRGACLFLLNLLRGLKDAGHDARLLCSSFGLRDEARRLGVDALEWSGLPGSWRLALFRRARRQLLSDWGVRIIHIQGQKLGFFARRLVATSRVPMVLSPESFFFDTQRIRGIQRYAQRVIAMDQDVREDCVNRARIPKDEVVLVPQGIDLDLTPVSLPRIGERTAVIGCVGPLVGGGGQNVFLRCAREVLDSGRKAHFVIGGDGPNERKLRRLCAELRLSSHVTFASRISSFQSVLECLDVFVRPSIIGGLGFTLLQAMACGKAVIASGVGGSYSLIEDGSTGRLIEKGNTEALTSAVCELVDAPEQAQQFGRSARDFVRDNLKMQTAVTRTVAVYEAAIAAYEARKASGSSLAF